MYAELINYSTDPPKVIRTIRIVDGKLVQTGDMSPEKRRHLEQEYHLFKTKLNGSDKDFLENRLDVVFASNTYYKPKFHPEE